MISSRTQTAFQRVGRINFTLSGVRGGRIPLTYSGSDRRLINTVRLFLTGLLLVLTCTNPSHLAATPVFWQATAAPSAPTLLISPPHTKDRSRGVASSRYRNRNNRGKHGRNGTRFEWANCRPVSILTNFPDFSQLKKTIFYFTITL